MPFNINVVNSCKYLSISATRYDSTSIQAEIKITDVETNTSTTAVMSYNSGTGMGSINVPVENLSATRGVFKVCVFEQGIEYACKPIMLKCDIDCCLTKLTNELLDCSCDCPRCASALAKAQKVFLLIQSSKAAVDIAGNNVSNSGYYLDINSKYKKAKEICDNSCGCDC